MYNLTEQNPKVNMLIDQSPSLPSLPTKISRSSEFESRLLINAQKNSDFCKKVPRDRINMEYADQLNRSACSIGANYIEANESESRRDFFHRIKICKKEAKESIYWHKIISHSVPVLKVSSDMLVEEAEELVRIFSAILKKNDS